MNAARRVIEALYDQRFIRYITAVAARTLSPRGRLAAAPAQRAGRREAARLVRPGGRQGRRRQRFGEARRLACAERDTNTGIVVRAAWRTPARRVPGEVTRKRRMPRAGLRHATPRQPGAFQFGDEPRVDPDMRAAGVANCDFAIACSFPAHYVARHIIPVMWPPELCGVQPFCAETGEAR